MADVLSGPDLVAEVLDVVVESVEPVEPVVAPERPVRRRRAAGRPAGAPSAAAAVDIVLTDTPTNGQADHPEPSTGGYLVTDDGDDDRPARRAASRPAGPSGSDGGDAVVVTLTTGS